MANRSAKYKQTNFTPVNKTPSGIGELCAKLFAAALSFLQCKCNEDFKTLSPN